MKAIKNLICYMFFLGLVASLSACGNTSSEIKRACKDGDFQKAHDLLENVDNEFDKRDIAKYLYSTEIEYLIGQNDENSSNRVIFLIKEMDKEDYAKNDKEDIINKALDLAYDQNNIYLIKKVLGLTAVWNQNIIIKLVKTSDFESRETIVNLLSKLGDFDIPSIGTRFEFTGRDERQDKKKEISEFNSKCIFVLDQAIFYKDEKLAKDIINIIKPNLNIEEWTLESYSYFDKETAQKKLDDAIKNGTFAE